MITCPGITHCSKCYKPLETGEFGICAECESEEKKLSEKVKVCDGSMIEEENKAIDDLKLTIEQEKEELPYSEESLKNNETLLNLIEKLQKENQELRNTKNNCPQFNTSGIKCKNKDIHCPTSKETLDYYENFLIPGYEEEIKKLKKEIEEKTIIIMAGAEKVKQIEKEFITKQEVKENYIPKDKIRELLENNYDISTENSRSISVEGAFAFVDDIEELLEEE